MAKKDEKRKLDKRKMVTQIIAGFLAGAMVLGVGATLIFYII